MKEVSSLVRSSRNFKDFKVMKAEEMKWGEVSWKPSVADLDWIVKNRETLMGYPRDIYHSCDRSCNENKTNSNVPSSDWCFLLFLHIRTLFAMKHSVTCHAYSYECVCLESSCHMVSQGKMSMWIIYHDVLRNTMTSFCPTFFLLPPLFPIPLSQLSLYLRHPSFLRILILIFSCCFLLAACQEKKGGMINPYEIHFLRAPCYN